MKLLDKGGDLNSINVYGQTPILFGSKSILKELDLLDAVAFVDVKNKNRDYFDNNKKLFHLKAETAREFTLHKDKNVTIEKLSK